MKRRKLKVIRAAWLSTMWLGVIGLLVGASLLLFGYLSHETAASAAAAASGTVEFNYYLEWSRVVGLVLFSAAGVLLAVALLLPSFLCQAQCIARSSIFDDGAGVGPFDDEQHRHYDDVLLILNTLFWGHIIFCS